MSYGFNMLFAEAKSISDAFLIAKDFVKNSCTEEKMKKTIEENAFYIPSIKGNAKPEDRVFCQTADRYWLYGLFNFRFVYWKEYQLLGLLSESIDGWPAPDHDKEKCSVYFQNSCDRDYKFSSWPAYIPFFKNAIKKFKRLKKMSAEKAYAILKEHGSCTPDKSTDFESGKKADAYYIRTALYDYIFDALALNDWLYGRDNDAFERFSINGLDTTEMLWDMSRYLNRYVNAQLNQVYNKDSCIIPIVMEGSANAYLFRYVYNKNDDAKELHVKEVISNVIKDYLNTEDGKRMASRFDGNIPYEEALEQIPETFFAKYHLFPLRECEYFTRATTYRYKEIVDI